MTENSCAQTILEDFISLQHVVHYIPHIGATLLTVLIKTAGPTEVPGKDDLAPRTSLW